MPLHILIADDEATARLLLKSALETCGFRVSVAADGEEPSGARAPNAAGARKRRVRR